MDGLETESEHQGTGCVKQEKETKSEKRGTENGERGSRLGNRPQRRK